MTPPATASAASTMRATRLPRSERKRRETEQRRQHQGPDTPGVADVVPAQDPDEAHEPEERRLGEPEERGDHDDERQLPTRSLHVSSYLTCSLASDLTDDPGHRLSRAEACRARGRSFRSRTQGERRPDGDGAPVISRWSRGKFVREND